MPKHNPYIMNINRGRNYYSYKEFSHIMRNCRNSRIMKQEKRLEYSENNVQSNLNGKENLIVLN